MKVLQSVFSLLLSVSFWKCPWEGEQRSTGLAAGCLFNVNFVLFLGLIEDRKEYAVLLNQASGLGKAEQVSRLWSPVLKQQGWERLHWWTRSCGGTSSSLPSLLFPPLPPTEGLNFSHLPTQYPAFKTKPLRSPVSKNRKCQGHGEDFLQRCRGTHSHLHLITHQRTV